jgi:hypothetical protein
MKWILRVHRRDPKRNVPLLMVDAGKYEKTGKKKKYLFKRKGSNHGLFSLIAGSSGAHIIAFEPQTHLQSKSYGYRKKEDKLI